MERPPSIEARDVALGRSGEQVERVDQLAELPEGVMAFEVVDRARLLKSELVDAVVDDVLPQPLEAISLQVDDRRQPLEPTPHLHPEPVERVAVNLEAEVL